MRLDQFLQKTLGISRVDARNVLKSKKVLINGVVIKQAKHQLDLTQDRVFYGDEALIYQEHYYWMLNKPKGYVSSHTHDGGIPIYELLADYSHVVMHCAGRLDVDTTGLVFITNDGQWSHKVAHPKQHCYKRYLVTLAHEINDQSIEQLENGVALKNEAVKTLPAKVTVVGPQKIYLDICEGKFHQVKRMLHTVGNEVIALHRECIGEVCLGNLAEGDFRTLTDEEIKVFLA